MLGDRVRLAAIALVVVLMISLPVYWQTHPLPPAAELTDGITDKDGHATEVFDQDVRRKFAIGSPVDILRDELGRQGLEKSQDGM